MRISDWSSDVCSSDLPPIIGRKMPQASAQEMNSAPVVSSLAGTLPIARLPSPAISAATSGRKTSAWIIGRSALHHVDIFNRDGPTVAEIGDKDCKADGGLARRHRDRPDSWKRRRG